ncbi:hypothetical protein K502DRAFT_353224 [Neoconidiobolus thromboides FSU 785]|nr:hypothetical protein K502DRAFT_353224 [Neoconidiobolus thromboides FSU 785]
MNELLLIKQIRVRQACDQCYKRKRRCDLSIPTCSECIEKVLVCTRERKTKRKPIMCDNEAFHSQTFLLSQSNKTRKEKKPDSIIILLYKYLNKFKISAGGSRFNSSVSIASIFPIKMFHSPIIFDQGFYSFYKVAPNQFLDLFFSKMPLVEPKDNIVKKNISIHNTMQQLVAIYFERINILLPLFTYNQFISKKRDMILIYSMLLVAITQNNDSGNLSELKVLLKDKMTHYFQPSRLKVNLSSIQSMVILLNGLKGSSSALPSYYFSNLHNHCMLLGLHMNHKNNTERKLCYSAALYILSVDDPYPNLLFDTHDLWKKSKITPEFNKNESIEVTMESITLTYSNYCYDCGLFYRHFFDIMLHIDTLKLSNTKVLKISHILKKLLVSITEKVMSRLEAIKQANSNKVLNGIINILVDHIKIVSHSDWVGLYSVKWSALGRDKESLFTQYAVNEKPKDFTTWESIIQSFILHNSRLESKYYSSVRFFALLLIINSVFAYSRWITNASSLIDQLLNQFNSLSKNVNTKLVPVIELVVQTINKK